MAAPGGAITEKARRFAAGFFVARRSPGQAVPAVRRLLLASVLSLLPLAAAAGDCRVLDPELQGTYQGGCRNGLANGEGVASGSAFYSGTFRKGMKHGRGVKRWPWGDRYEGEFRDDRKHGQGMYVWGEGSPWAGQRYVGDFAADLRHGRGSYYWPNGDRFDGEWREDLRYGLTAMEQRREAARKAREAVLGVPGTTVCRQVKVGIAREARLRGETAGLVDGTLEVRITAVGDAGPGLLPSQRIGDRVQGDIWTWTPCL
jgi:hypothetical protein